MSDNTPPDAAEWGRRLAEYQEWEAKLMRGEVSLFDGLMMCLASGAPAGPYLMARLEAAFQAYQYGDADSDLAKEFGIASTKRERNAEAAKTMASHIRFHVDSFHAQGFKKVNPSVYDNTAFHAAGRLLNKSPSHVYDVYRGQGKRKR